MILTVMKFRRFLARGQTYLPTSVVEQSWLFHCYANTNLLHIYKFTQTKHKQIKLVLVLHCRPVLCSKVLMPITTVGIGASQVVIKGCQTWPQQPISHDSILLLLIGTDPPASTALLTGDGTGIQTERGQGGDHPWRARQSEAGSQRVDPSPAREVRPQWPPQPSDPRHLPPRLQCHGVGLWGRNNKGWFLCRERSLFPLWVIIYAFSFSVPSPLLLLLFPFLSCSPTPPSLYLPFSLLLSPLNFIGLFSSSCSSPAPHCLLLFLICFLLFILNLILFPLLPLLLICLLILLLLLFPSLHLPSPSFPVPAAPFLPPPFFSPSSLPPPLPSAPFTSHLYSTFSCPPPCSPSPASSHTSPFLHLLFPLFLPIRLLLHAPPPICHWPLHLSPPPRLCTPHVFLEASSHPL